MKREIWLLPGKEVMILCGDGRSVSLGHSAKYGTYTLIEQFLDVIVDIEIIDKRETGGVSTNMEVAGLRQLLERIVGKLVVNEIVTDERYALYYNYLKHLFQIGHHNIKKLKLSQLV